MNKKRIPLKKRPPTAQEVLVEELYGFEVKQPKKATIYRVRLVCELPYPNCPVPGRLKIDEFCFDATDDMIDSGERLNKVISEWRNTFKNSVMVNIYHAKCTKRNELVHYVELLPSKWFSGIACPEHEYHALRAFIRSLREYQSVP